MVVRSNNIPEGTVVLNVIGQLASSTFTPGLPTSGNPSVTTAFSFSPTIAQAGTYSMNFTATEGGFQTTCGYSIVVPAPNTVVSLSGSRGGNAVRLQTKISGTLCSIPVYDLFKRVGGAGAFAAAVTGSASPLFVQALTGPAGTLNEFYSVMRFANSCSTPSQSNTISFVF